MSIDNTSLEFDRDHIWHPYASTVDPLPVFPVDSASGVRIKLADGRELIDGMASWWCAIHGYNHPALNAAVTTQLESTAHVMFGGFTHEPAIELARTLVEITPAPLEVVFFADSGSVSVEAAIKMAIQYWAARGKSRKQKLLTIRQGYHGDTLGAMAVCDPVTGMHSLFSEVLSQHYFADAPKCRFEQAWDETDIDSFRSLIEIHQQELAAVIVEPIVQGAGGMWFYSPEYLRCVRELCDEYGTLLILDEIATGFGRSGKMFASEHAGISPDIMCVGKALTGGYMTLAATLASRDVADTISGDGSGAFMHGPTFMANPLACAVANCSVGLLLSQPWQTRVKAIETQLTNELDSCSAMVNVRDVRVLGAIGVVELETPVDMRRAAQMFVERVVWVRPFGRLVYLMPPYTIEPDDLSQLTKAIAEVVASLEEAA